MSIHIGTSGWSYDHWHGVLYPHGAAARERLGYYLPHFSTVELNSSYYRWPRDAAFARWRRLLPEGFRLTVKAPRGLTHAKRLFKPERWAGRIVAAFETLGPKAGALLVQLPPGMDCDYPRLDYFLGLLPSWLKVAVEFRHPGWHREEIFALLERRGAAYCVMSGANLPCVLRATAPFVYVRLHGPSREHLYAGSYPDEDLRWWAARIGEWAGAGREVFAYFNNDGGGNAVRDAARLAAACR
ncbi:MAG TPA: DUF72 domain-containing protein [Pyrinomonadaceae bacterium]|nr:DUF72 domain-containing protein [Pyrinomonadaceae bacterium]